MTTISRYEALVTIAQVVVRMRTKDDRPATQFDCNAGVNSASELIDASGLAPTTPEERVAAHAELMRRMGGRPEMTEAVALRLAKVDPLYVARCMRGKWIVWDRRSDHAVEFADNMIEAAIRSVERA